MGRVGVRRFGVRATLVAASVAMSAALSATGCLSDAAADPGRPTGAPAPDGGDDTAPRLHSARRGPVAAEPAPPEPPSPPMVDDGVPVAGRCPLFSPASIFRRRVDALAPGDAALLSILPPSTRVHVAISSQPWKGSRPGMPLNVADASTPRVPVALDPGFGGNSYPGPYPIPPGVRVEGDPGPPLWDQRMLTVDTDECVAYELFQYNPLVGSALGRHRAVSGYRYDLRDGVVPPPAAASVSRIPNIATLARAEEVLAGVVAHPIGGCSSRTSPEHRWPARGSDGTTPGGIPVGTWLRLRADVSPARFTGQGRTLAVALRNHGMLVEDTCSHDLAFTAENHPTAWRSADLASLRSLTVADFEVVDADPLMADPGTWQATG